MDNIVNLPIGAILALAEIASRADLEGRTLRIAVGNSRGDNYLCYKIGEDMWSAPQYSID